MGASCCKEEIDFDGEVQLNHFDLCRSVGRGAFGKVRIVRHRKEAKFYALKYIDKERCIKQKAVKNIIQERKLLEDLEFPLIVNLRYAFQDDENMFMVIDLMLGGDLRFHLDRKGAMKEEVVRFYLAEVSLGLAYLHTKNIVHRDIKPDNVLLDEKGHCHITDFNVAAFYYEGKPLSSVAGSRPYMAPEILGRSPNGYTHIVDWWSLGVLGYELLFAVRPFKGKTYDSLTHSILHDPLTFPEGKYNDLSKDCLDVVRKYLERDVAKRLGSATDEVAAIKEEKWFSGLDWDGLTNKRVTAPFIPDDKNGNFDATYELEEILLEDNPLRHRKRAAQKAAEAGKPPPQLSSKMQYIEDNFKIYDYTKHANKGDKAPNQEHIEAFEDLPNFEGADDPKKDPGHESSSEPSPNSPTGIPSPATPSTAPSLTPPPPST